MRLSSDAWLYWLALYVREGGTHIIFPTNSIVPGSGGRIFTFREKKWKGERRIFGVDYRGIGVGEAWDMMIKAVEYT